MPCLHVNSAKLVDVKWGLLLDTTSSGKPWVAKIKWGLLIVFFFSSQGCTEWGISNVLIYCTKSNCFFNFLVQFWPPHVCTSNCFHTTYTRGSQCSCPNILVGWWTCSPKGHYPAYWTVHPFYCDMVQGSHHNTPESNLQSQIDGPCLVQDQ